MPIRFRFFFSSRRRHTRLVSDWSSDVCSSDLSSGGGVSVGVGVAINYAKIRNEAILPAGANVYSVGATIEALMGSTHELGASATSGAGGGSVGVAGSVAIDIENIETTARLAGILTAGTGAGADVAITATSHATSDTKALPEESTGGVSGASSVGGGASVAVAIVDDTTTAELPGVLLGGRNVTLAAPASHGMTTPAKPRAPGAKR